MDRLTSAAVKTPVVAGKVLVTSPQRPGVGYELEIQAKSLEAMSPVLTRTDWSHSRTGKWL